MGAVFRIVLEYFDAERFIHGSFRLLDQVFHSRSGSRLRAIGSFHRELMLRGRDLGEDFVSRVWPDEWKFGYLQCLTLDESEFLERLEELLSA
jgi:hypothetical protein